MPTPDTKVCTKCKQRLPITNFVRDNSRTDGRYAQCKACVSAYRRKWYAENRDARLAYNVQYQAKTKAQKSAYWHKNKERFKALAKAKEAALPEEERKRLRRERSIRNDENARSRARRAAVPAESIDRNAIFERDGGHCCQCRVELNPDNWHLDHIVPLALGGPHIWANVQALCPPCNLRKWATLDGQIHMPV